MCLINVMHYYFLNILKIFIGLISSALQDFFHLKLSNILIFVGAIFFISVHQLQHSLFKECNL